MKWLIAALIAATGLTGCIVVPRERGYYDRGYYDRGYYGDRYYHHRDWR
ncbi:MAG TPA: hypothetical protein VN667_04570 [Burkholderiales bacterium]|nr:hypothetical protein [Burkholderiales bacterium]